MQTIAMTRSDLMLLGGAFRDSSGSALDREAINAIAQANLGRGIHAGGSTLARGALLRALVSETGEGRGDGNGRSTSLLEALLETVRHSPSTSSRGIFNCRINGLSASVNAVYTVDQLHRQKKIPCGTCPVWTPIFQGRASITGSREEANEKAARRI